MRRLHLFSQTLALLLFSPCLVAEEAVLLDLSSSPEMKFSVTNDGVMGGLSQGTASRDEEKDLHFRGTLSLENNGGFSSVWFGHGEYDLSSATGITLKVKGDGRNYHLQVETSARHRGEPVSFQAEFETKEHEWVTVLVPFADLYPTWRGDRLDTIFDASEVETFGIILLEKNPGPFAITLAEVGSY